MIDDAEIRFKETWLVREDGLWDICIGFSVMGLGITVALNQAIWFIAFTTLAYFLVVMAGKEVITRPRFLYFDICQRQLVNLSRAFRIGLIIAIVCLVLGAISFFIIGKGVSWLSWISKYAYKALGVILSAVMVAFGILGLGGVRYYIYAGLIFIAFVIYQIFEFSTVPLLILISVLLLVSGALLLVRFIFKYPKSNPSEI
jgi:hypothetical protein